MYNHVYIYIIYIYIYLYIYISIYLIHAVSMSISVSIGLSIWATKERALEKQLEALGVQEEEEDGNPWGVPWWG